MTNANQTTLLKRGTNNSHHCRQSLDSGSTRLNDRSGRSSRHYHLSSNSSFSSLRTNSSESLVSFFGTTTAGLQTGNSVTATRPPRRIRQRTWSSTSLSTSPFPTTIRNFFSNTRRLVQWVVLVASLIVCEQWAALHSWLATEYQYNPDSVAASFSASVSRFTATASLSVASNSRSGLFSTSYNPPIATEAGLHMVVSHCDKPLDWLWRRVVQADQKLKQENSDTFLILKNIKSITIFSKCGQEVVLKGSLPPMAKVVALPNVGRCDHSYAYWIAHVLGHMKNQTKDFIERSLFHPKDVIWFVKDNDNSYRSRVEIGVSLEQMLQSTTRQAGFACASRVSPRLGEEMGYRGVKALNVAVQKNIGRFQMYSVYSRDNYTIFGDEIENEADAVADSNTDPKNNIRDPFFPVNPNITVLEEWVDSLPIYNLSLGNKAVRSSTYSVWDASQKKAVSFSPPPNYLNAFMPICFGGIFMATFERLKYAPVGDWSALAESLSRGDNIEEGHFMERLWAALLSEPMSQMEQQLIHNSEYTVVKRASPYKGLVLIPSDSIEQDLSEGEKVHGLEPATWWSQLMLKLGLASAVSVVRNHDKALMSAAFDIPTIGIHVVVSHCDKPLDWIWDQLLLMTENVNLPSVYPIKSITVITTCGNPPLKNELPRLRNTITFAKHGIDPVRIIESLNFGPSHHPYAYWIAHLLKKEQSYDGLYFSQDSVLFVQDSNNGLYHEKSGASHSKAKFRKLYDQSLKLGFFCGNSLPASTLLMAPGDTMTQNEQDELDQNNFALHIASKRNLGDYKPTQTKSMREWVDVDMAGVWNITMGITAAETAAAKAVVQVLMEEKAQTAINRTLMQDVPTFMPVCLGGHFMVTMERVLSAPVNDWNQVAIAIQNSNWDSNRFIERLWAVLFSPQFQKEDQMALLWQDFIVVKRQGPYKGMVSISRKTEPPVPSRKKKGWKVKREPFMKQWMAQEDIILKKYWT
ncbi:hypothetical protein IV203_026118 [Nitzschia inconspicua]|uniref:Uncharacterized protein n=1 Tax=Nitzschia inconspicua TaxID=303405 RepID=A0A9K3PWY5_9STRA|nr:hypothetical protein IV203_026118 [Nitzschia inconspicua]